MSTDRSTNPNRPLRPTLASNRTRTPITPRVATNATATPCTKSTASKPSPSIRSEPSTPRPKATSTPLNNVIANGNVTPRSSARTSRVGSASPSLSQNEETPSSQRPKSAVVTAGVSGLRAGNAGGLGITVGDQSKARTSRAKSLASENGAIGRTQSPPVKSPNMDDGERSSVLDSVETRFFRASDAPKQQDAAPKRPEPKKAASFFYADGQQESQQDGSVAPASPVLSALSEQRSAGPWIRPGSVPNDVKNPPMLSPALSSLSSTSPFFASGIGPNRQRSPSPSKENIHLSYRRGVSQIIGTRPTPPARSTTSTADLPHVTQGVRRAPNNARAEPDILQHRKSPSLSSIDSGDSDPSRRRSVTAADTEGSTSPLSREVRAATLPLAAKAVTQLPTIDTSLESPGLRPPAGDALSPSKKVSELAADARRERKVLDLEISNSSLMAINTSLEREVRRQKAELKRFRRLSRAGRFSFAPTDRLSRGSDGLSVVGEEDEEDEIGSMFGPASGFSELYDDMSDDEESITSSVEPLSPSARSRRESDRLAKDEKRLRVDLAKHRELLVQSQAMNQSLKRCTYATEEMIREGKKALDYQVRVADVNLGGRVLSTHEDDEYESPDIELEDERDHDDDVAEAKGALDIWAGVGRPSLEDSENGDRDSGIDVDRPAHILLPPAAKSGGFAVSGRPPDDSRVGRVTSLS